MSARIRTCRLFFALWPSEAMRARLAQAASVATAHARGRAVPVQNLHVTLVFVGEIEHGRVPAVLEAGAASRGEPTVLELERIESWRGSRLLCLTCERAPAALASLAEALRRELLQRDIRIRREEVFRPHVTLARDLPRPQPATSVAPLDWRVKDFVLVRSERERGRGSQYSVMERWPLG